MGARLPAAALTIMICSTQVWGQESLLENSNSPRERAIARSGTGVGLAAPVPTGSLTVPMATTGTLGTIVGTTVGTMVGTTRGTPVGTTVGQ